MKADVPAVAWARPAARGSLGDLARLVGGDAPAEVPPGPLTADLSAGARPATRGRLGNLACPHGGTWRAADPKTAPFGTDVNAGPASTVTVRSATSGAIIGIKSYADITRAQVLKKPARRGLGGTNGVTTRTIAGTTTGATTARRECRRGGCGLRLSATAPNDEHRKHCEKPK